MYKMKLKVAVLDDYQKVGHKFTNWKSLRNKIELKFFHNYIDNNEELIKSLFPFEVLCLMRERTKLTNEIIKKLPNLKLIITSGMWNPSVQLEELNRKKIIFCGTDNQFNSTAELSWLLTMLVWRGVLEEFENMKNGKWQSKIGKSLFVKIVKLCLIL